MVESQRFEQGAIKRVMFAVPLIILSPGVVENRRAGCLDRSNLVTGRRYGDHHTRTWLKSPFLRASSSTKRTIQPVTSTFSANKRRRFACHSALS